MLSASLPASNVLADLAANIEFIRLIATTEGLTAAITQIHDAIKQNESIVAEIQTQRQGNADDLAQIAKRKADADAATLQANKLIEEAREQQNAAQDLMDTVARKQRELAENEAAFEKSSTAKEKSLAAREEKLQQDQANAQAKLDEANGIKADYEQKIDQLGEIVGKG